MFGINVRSTAVKLIGTSIFSLALVGGVLATPALAASGSDTATGSGSSYAEAASNSIPPMPCIPNVDCSYHGTYNGRVIDLAHVINVSVEDLPDATLVGHLTNFQTNNPYYHCLNGETLNVWVAPNEFPNDYVVHNGDEGPQCVYGTWLFPQPNPRFTGLLGSRYATLDHVINLSVEDLPDAQAVGMLIGFQTNDPYYSRLNGKALRVWVAPNEFPDDFVIHNGDQGPQATYGTWLLPRR